MAIPTKAVTDRITTFRAAWREIAPSTSFAQLTLAQFEAATDTALTVRQEIDALERQLVAKKVDRDLADQAANDLMDRVVNSVRGTPGYGADCSLYRAMGYVRKSERRSGLTRKGARKTAATADTDAPAADAA